MEIPFLIKFVTDMLLKNNQTPNSAFETRFFIDPLLLLHWPAWAATCCFEHELIELLKILPATRVCWWLTLQVFCWVATGWTACQVSLTDSERRVVNRRKAPNTWPYWRIPAQPVPANGKHSHLPIAFDMWNQWEGQTLFYFFVLILIVSQFKVQLLV